MITTADAFYATHPMTQTHYDPEFFYYPSVTHNSNQFAPRAPAQTEVLQHGNFSWWPPTNDGVVLDSHGFHTAESTTTPEAQRLTSPCYPYQDELCYRRGSTVSASDFDSGESMQSAITTASTAAPPPPPPPPRPALRRQSSSSTATTSGSSRPHECGHCTRTFARRHDLERHTRVHTGIKPYVCPCCLKAFPRSDARGRHFRNEPSCRAGPQVLAWMKKNTRSTI